MSRYLNSRYQALRPYTPGEQGLEGIRIKLNTNESPFPPSKQVQQAVTDAASRIHLYSDPEGKRLREALAKRYGINRDQIILGNGSDELLFLAFLAFCSAETGVACPVISYGFYPVYAQMAGAPYNGIALTSDLRISAEDYLALNQPIVLANPNAPTGTILSLNEIESILQSNKNYVVLVDEAYVDFGGESCLSLLAKYENLLIVQTFSKSRSLAGGRLGFAMGHVGLIADLQRLRYSLNPYNVNSLTLAAAEAALAEEDLFQERCIEIASIRDWTQAQLQSLSFRITKSKGNFVFVSPPDGDAVGYAAYLKAQGILIRYFSIDPIATFVRISIGTKQDMEILISLTSKRYPTKEGLQ
jgi:histidinol-phosphate aminotransferase